MNRQGTFRGIAESERLRVAGIDRDRLRLRLQNVTVRGLCLGHDIRAGGQLFQHDLTVAVCLIDAVGAGQALVVRGQFAVGGGDLELRAGQRLAGGAVDLLHDQAALGRVAKLQSDRFVGFNLHRLRRIVENITGNGARFLYHHGLSRLQIVDEDAARVVGGVLSVAVPNHSAVAVGDKELHAGERRAGQRVLLGDEQTAHLLIAIGDGDKILILTGQIHRARVRGVHHISGRRGDFVDDVRPFVEAVDLNLALIVGGVLAQRRTVH